jgi:hypothetical protein
MSDFLLLYNFLITVHVDAISGSRGGEYEDGCLLGCCTV